MRYPRIRFSLRLLLGVIALCAVVSYWLALPSIKARRFVTAMRAERFDVAEQLFVYGDHGDATTFADFDDVLRQDNLGVAVAMMWLPTNFGTQHQLRDATFEIRPLTWRDFRQGRRKVSMDVPAQGDHSSTSCVVTYYATRAWLEPQSYSASGGSPYQLASERLNEKIFHYYKARGAKLQNPWGRNTE